MVRATCLAALSALVIAVPGADAAGGLLTRPSGQRPAAIALDYVREHPRKLGLDSNDISGLRLTRAYRSGSGTVHLQWEQAYRGIPVFGPGLRANVAVDGRLIDVGEAAVPDPGVDSIKPRLPAPARDASLTLFRGDRLAWHFLDHVDATHVYETVTDANTGQTLWRANKVREATARVFGNYPGAAVGGTQVDRDITPWLSEAGRLIGNNAHVYSDEDDDIDGVGVDGTPQPADEILPSGGGNWLYSQVTQGATSPGQSCPTAGCTWNSFDPVAFGPAVNRSQAGTQLFYFVNRFHDWLRDAPGIGFNAASGAHEGSDPVQAQIDDGAALSDCDHRNNAYVLPVPDGTRMLMQVLLWSGSCIGGFTDVNPADDAYVINHEYAHGMTNRLVTYSNGFPGLDARQSWAMDEGFADWYALDHLVSQGFWPDSGTPGELDVGVYENAALRSQPIDCPVTPVVAACPGDGTAGPGGYTYGDFAHVYPGGWEPHADGEIWVETLWDLRTRMLAAHPGDGLTRTRAIVTDALRNVGANPSFLDMRDAILTASTVRGYGSADLALIWRAFAARGMGIDASTDGPDDTAPRQGFLVPAPPPAPPAPPAPDRTRPTLKKASMLRKRFRIGVRSAFKFTLSEVATVEIALARAERGRRAKGRCRPATRRLRKRPRCTRYVKAGSLVKINMAPGAHSVRFKGKLRGRALRVGSYRAVIRATDPSGNRSRGATLRFSIIRR